MTSRDEEQHGPPIELELRRWLVASRSLAEQRAAADSAQAKYSHICGDPACLSSLTGSQGNQSIVPPLDHVPKQRDCGRI